MWKWIRSNWARGADGKRQVVLAGLLFIEILSASGSAAWLTWRAPLRYRMVLQGKDKIGPYFTALAVASPNRWQAGRVALRAAQRHGLRIVRIAEIEATGLAPGGGASRVLKAPWARAYYLDDDESSQSSRR